MTTELPQAPALTLTAVGTGREVDFKAPGGPMLLICLKQETQSAAEIVEEAVRARWPLASELLVSHVLDLRGVPGLFRKMAESIMDGEYTKAVDSLKEGQDAFDYVLILPDWQGTAVMALGLDATEGALGLGMLTADGRLAGILIGAPTEQVEAMIEAGIRG